MSAATLTDSIPTATATQIGQLIRRYVRSFSKSLRATQPAPLELANQQRTAAQRSQQVLVANLSAMR